MTPDIEKAIAAARYNREAQFGQVVTAAAAMIGGSLFKRRSATASTRRAGFGPAGSRA